MVYETLPLLKRPDMHQMAELAEDLVSLAYRFGSVVVHASLRCLARYGKVVRDFRCLEVHRDWFGYFSLHTPTNRFGPAWFECRRFKILLVDPVRAPQVRSRPVRFGSVRFGSVRFGSVRFGSVRFGSVRFGSVRFGSVRFGSIWSSSVRFGSVRSET